MDRYLTLSFLCLFILLGGMAGCRNEPADALPTLLPPPTAGVATETSLPPTATATVEAPPAAEATPTLEATATTAVEPSPTAAAAEPEATAPAATPTLALPTATLEPVAGEPGEIVRDFLDSYMREDETAEMTRYLDAALRAQVAASGAERQTITELLGISRPYRSFALTLLDDGSRDGEAAVRAALNYAEPVYLRFLLTLHENDSWYISAIEPQEAPPTADDPGEVANEFLTSLLYDRTGNSSLPFLSAGLQQEVAGGRSVLDLLGVEQIYSTYNYVLLNDGSISGTATVEATLSYGSGPVTVTFTLVEEADGWRISQISRS